MTFITDTTIGRFTVHAPLGRGFLGDTFRASDRILGREVRIELLPGTVTGDSDQLAHIEQAIGKTASLHHPNIAEVYGLETTNSIHIIASELPEGRTLADWLAEGLFPLQESLSIARGIAGGLQAAHDQNLVHGALSTHCVTLVRSTGAVKLCDLGLAALRVGGENRVESGSAPAPAPPAAPARSPAGAGAAAVATPCLVSNSGVRAADKPSDVWAYGCIVFELLTGLQPFSGRDKAITPETETFPGPKWDYLPPVPRAVRELLQRCLDRDPRRRPGMAEVTAELDRVPLKTVEVKKETGKLGLSLAGGGFRASLFHVGVLRRLAELDILRRVEVLSTVSGGSITGALYALLLKKYLEKAGSASPRLSRDQYIEIVDALQDVLVRGVGKDLRTRLLLNPLGNLLMFIAGDSLSRRMARMYERHLMAGIVKDLEVERPTGRLWARFQGGQIRMRDLAVRLPGLKPKDVPEYNQEQRRTGGSVLTRLVLNATSVNSSGRFFFSADELGDWYLGYFREDEFDCLVARKDLLELAPEQLARVAKGEDKAPTGSWNDPTERQRAATVAYWWKMGRHLREDVPQARNFRPGSSSETVENMWGSLFHANHGAQKAVLDRFRNPLLNTALGLLRRAKVAASHLLSEPRGSRELARFTLALKEIDPDLESEVSSLGPSVVLDICDYIRQLYWVRSAERMSHKIVRDWNQVRLGEAVGASACFPPVFPPFIFHGLYDDLFTMRLGLTDGGVYDNTGVTALMDEGCSEIIASDTGGVFKEQPLSAANSLGLALRIPDLLTNSLGGVQREHLRERRQVSKDLSDLLPRPGEIPNQTQQNVAELHTARALDSLVYFHITSPPCAPATPDQYDPLGPALNPVPDPHDIARLRTDLDGFGETEIAALVNHGYSITDRYVRRYAPALVRDSLNGHAPKAPALPWPDTFEPDWVHRMLAVGSERFFRALRVGSAWSWAGMVVVATVLLGWAWKADVTIERVFGAGVDAMKQEITLLGPAARAPAALIALLVVGILWMLSRVSRIPDKKDGAARSGWGLKCTRWIRTGLKIARAGLGNALWGLFFLPAILALLISAVGCFSFVFFHLPYMHATRLARAKQAS